eukprot:575056-Pelagomonas_calceolata.AAC.1
MTAPLCVFSDMTNVEEAPMDREREWTCPEGAEVVVNREGVVQNVSAHAQAAAVCKGDAVKHRPCTAWTLKSLCSSHWHLCVSQLRGTAPFT